jgi:hypothetical protein
MSFSILPFDNSPQRQLDVERLVALWKANWDESLLAKYGEFKINIPAIFNQWRDGQIAIVVYRANGVLAGFQAWSIGVSHMAPGMKIANMIAVYLDKPERGKKTWPEFLKFGLLAMDAHGVSQKHISVDYGSKMQSFLERNGARPMTAVMVYG